MNVERPMKMIRMEMSRWVEAGGDLGLRSSTAKISGDRRGSVGT